MQEDIISSLRLALLDFMVAKLPFMKYFHAEKLDRVRNRRDATMLKLLKQKVNDDKLEKSYVDYTHEMVKSGEFTQDEKIADANVLFLAGMDTTSSTLDLGMVLIAKYQDI